MSNIRNRGDRCPGALRPWSAVDGMLVRLRLIGGQVSSAALHALADVAGAYGDGRVHLTSRANLQVRALPGSSGSLDPAVLAAIEATGLLPTRTHELIRNVMVSPQTGLAGGRVDLRGVARDLDALVCADPLLAGLPGRFLFVLDDGRGDLLPRRCDLGLVALDSSSVQLRVGAGFGPVVSLTEAAARIAELAVAFAVRRGSGRSAPWHVAELHTPLIGTALPDPELPSPSPPLAFGDVPGGRHVPIPDEGLGREAVRQLTARAASVVVTPWRGVLIPEETR